MTRPLLNFLPQLSLASVTEMSIEGYTKVFIIHFSFFSMSNRKNQWQKIFMYRVTDIPSVNIFPFRPSLYTVHEAAHSYMLER